MNEVGHGNPCLSDWGSIEEDRMIEFVVAPCYTHIYSASPAEIMVIKEALTFVDSDAHFKKALNPWAKDKVCLLEGNRFPSGLLFLVWEELEKEGSEVCLKSTYTAPKPLKKPSEALKGMEYRDYQEKCAEKALKAKRGYFQIATAGGKTEIARVIIDCIDRRTLYLVHLKELLHQTRRSFAERMGISESRIGLIGDGEFTLKDLTIGMVQSAGRILKGPSNVKKEDFLDWIEGVKVLFIDECHHTSSPTFYNLAMRIPAPYRFGMSGTAITGKGLKDNRLIAVTGDQIYDKTANELKNEGHISDADIAFFRVTKATHPEYKHVVDLNALYPTNPVEKVMGESEAEFAKRKRAHYAKLSDDFRHVYLKGVVENRHRNLMIAKIAKFNLDKQILILVSRTKHLHLLYDIMKDIYKKGELVTATGETPGEERQWMVDKFNARSVKCIISTVFQEGANMPDIEILVVAGAGESSILTKQRIGRGLRKKKSGDPLQAYDFMDLTHPFLRRHSIKRINLLRQEGFSIRQL